MQNTNNNVALNDSKLEIKITTDEEKKTWKNESTNNHWKEENLNTYIVSHGWTHPLLEKIEVIKEGEMSYLNE